MIDVSGLVGAIPTITVTLRTFGATAVDPILGETSATVTDVALEAVVHPLGRRELVRVFGADYRRETISVYSASEELASVGDRQPGRVLYNGRWYEIISSADYAPVGGGIFLSYASLIEDQLP